MKLSEKRDRLARISNSNKKCGLVAIGIAAFCCLGLFLHAGAGSVMAEVNLDDFDHKGRKLYQAGDQTPAIFLSADSGDRNLAGFYSLRQYPGSPPRIPHVVDISFSGEETECLSCHAKGGYSQEFGKFIPVTPHPENTLCYQCHAQVTTEELFVESNWLSIEPPKLGMSFLSNSPPSVPHTLQLRENCISCHTGPGAVVEIRVSHADRGNCRQCHVPAPQTTPVVEFSRK